VDVRSADVTALPYPDGAFDAVWCANALEYLDDAAFPVALAEFRRVVRPGGLVAIQDPDPGLWLVAPGDPTLLPRTWAAAGRVSTAFRGCFRTRTLRRRLERLGLVDVWQRATLSELWAPLRPIQRRYIGQQLRQMGALAEQAGMAAADLAFWQRQRDPEAAECLVHDPELFWCEGHFVAVGRVPDAQP
jgi:SAM-dependent methyltransferase